MMVVVGGLWRLCVGHGGCGWVMAVVWGVMVGHGGSWWLCVGHGGCVWVMAVVWRVMVVVWVMVVVCV